MASCIRHPAYIPPKAQKFEINHFLHFERYDSFVWCRAMTHTLAQKVRCHAVLRQLLLESVRVFWNILYMALPLCFVPSYLNVLERILLDGDFHDFCGPKQASTLPNSNHEWHMMQSIVNSQKTQSVVANNSDFFYSFKIFDTVHETDLIQPFTSFFLHINLHKISASRPDRFIPWESILVSFE